MGIIGLGIGGYFIFMQEKDVKKPITTERVILGVETSFLTAVVWVAEHNLETLKRFLKAIEKGNGLIKENKKEAITIVSQRLKMERELVSSVWDDFEFQLVLDHSILITLEDEARWVIKNNLTDKIEVPNYLNYIYVDALEEIKPEAVTIIR